MAEAWLRSAALLSALWGMGCCALALPAHWTRLRGAAPQRARRLRVRGVAGLGLSLGLCLAADHASMAVLVWVMLCSLSVVLIALLLAFRPSWLRVLLAR